MRGLCRRAVRLVVFAAAIAGSASAQEAGYYAAVQGGISFPSNFETAGTYGGVLGYTFPSGLRTELDGLYANYAIKTLDGSPASGHIAATTLMLSGLYGFGPGQLKPYVGAGFGMQDVSVRVRDSSDSAWAPAYQVRGGVSYGFTQKLFGSVEYRWVQGELPKLTVSGIPAKFEIKHHGVVVALNYNL